jgi:hypothetical protein
MKYWTTQNHEEIAYNKLEDYHLKNILRWIERKAEEGLEEMYGGGIDAEDIWFDSDTIYGDDVKEKYDYKGLMKEAKKRGLKLTNHATTKM